MARLGLGCLALAWATLASADVQEYASVSVGNNHAQNPGGIYVKGVSLGDRMSLSSRLIDTGVVSQSFTGLSADGLVEQEFFTGQASAYGSFGSIKVGASYALTNRLANGANPNYVNADFSVNPDGVPNSFRSDALVRVKDSITVTGGAGLESVEFTFRLTGHVASFEQEFNSANESLLLVSGFMAEPGGSYFYEGNYDQLLVGRVKLVNGVADYGISMMAVTALWTVYPEHPWWFHGRDSNGTVDFMHSMDLMSVVGRAADGSQVALTSAVGSTGFDYLAPTAVPEPQSLLLMLAGLGLFALRRLKPAARTR